MRQFLKTIPALRYLLGQHRLRHFRHACGPEFSRLSHCVPPGVPPLVLANSLRQFEALLRHPRFPPNLIEPLIPPGPGSMLERAFVNYTLGLVAEQQLAGEWQHAVTLSEESERRLTEYLNRYITYPLRTLAGHLEAWGQPTSAETIRSRRMLTELDGEDGELLDVGCAFVPLAERYARMRRWVGLDLSLPALSLARLLHGAPAAALVCGYSENLPFADHSFDCVISSEVLEHTPRPRRMIAEIARVLRGGGKAVVSVPMHIVDFQNGRQHRIGPTDSTHRLRFHSLKELHGLFEEHGLAVERLLSDPHYVFTLRRKAGMECSSFGVGCSDQTDQSDGTDSPDPSHRLSPDRTPDTEHRTPPTAFACPDCRGPLQPAHSALFCPACDAGFTRRDGVPVLLPRYLRAARLDMVH